MLTGSAWRTYKKIHDCYIRLANLCRCLTHWTDELFDSNGCDEEECAFFYLHDIMKEARWHGWLDGRRNIEMMLRGECGVDDERREEEMGGGTKLSNPA